MDKDTVSEQGMAMSTRGDHSTNPFKKSVVGDMNDQEKSVIIAKAMGWVEHEHGEAPIYEARWQSPDKPGSWWLSPPNLYNPINMALAWRVHLWMLEQELGKRESPYAVSPKPYTRWWNLGSPWGYAAAQRLWLDKILELAIGAVIVE